MAPPQPGYGTTAKRKRSSASLTETKQDLRPEQDHSRSGSAPSTSWAECRDKKGSAPSRRKEMSLDIPLYRTCPASLGFSLRNQIHRQVSTWDARPVDRSFCRGITVSLSMRCTGPVGPFNAMAL